MTIEFTIEGWTYNPYKDEIYIPEDDIEGMTEEERDSFIEGTVAEAVGNVVSWGWKIKDG